ncbi:MAG TPA: hypothetical protein VMU47_07645 [Caldimonas sp.]|nr:hypothetical protein [Caldimonas sp.]
MSGDVRSSGLSNTTNADGTQQLRIERIDARDVQMESNFGTLRAAAAALSNVTVDLRTAPPSAGLPGRMRELRVGEWRLEGARVEVPIIRVPRPTTAPHGKWRMEPLGAVDGSMHAGITDAHWMFDADVTIPIGSGRIDFDRATVEHIGPDSSMGISRMGVYVDAPNGRTYLYLFSATHIPGATFERRGALFARRTGSRGALELRPFAECWLSGTTMGALATGIRDMLGRTRLSATLRLGDGVMGNDRHRVALGGRDQGRNRIELSSGESGEAVLRMHDLSVIGSRLEVADYVVETGPLSATLSVQVTNLAATPVAAMSIAALTVRDVACLRRQASNG